MSRWLIPLALAVASPAFAAKPPPAPVTQPAPKGRMVFAVQTGNEDLQRLGSAIRHAKVVQQSGVLAEVELVFFGRSGMLFDDAAKVYPPELVTALAEARVAGVRVVVCANTLDHFGIPADKVTRGEVVPMGIVEIATRVSDGWEVVNY